MGWTTYPEPEWTADNMNRDSDAWTFKQCGWCKYGGGVHRYNCMIEGSCDILDHTVDDYKDYKDKTKVYWNTPCKITDMSRAEAKYWVRHYDYIIKNKHSEIKRLKNAQTDLADLAPELHYLPEIPSERENDPPKGERVRVFLSKLDQPKQYPKGWYKATVVDGYRTGDGCISYVIDSIPESKKGWGCGSARPEVITESDYQFFKEHPDLFMEWKMKIKKKNLYMEFDADDMTLEGEI